MAANKKTLPVTEIVVKMKFFDHRFAGKRDGKPVFSDELAELTEAGFQLVRETPQAREMVRKDQIERAKTRGVEPFRFSRKDATGELVPDWGTPVFGENGLTDVQIKTSLTDIRAIAGMKLVSADVFQRLGDNRNAYFLRLTFSREEDRPAIGLNGTQWVLVRELADKVWGHVHVWRNDAGYNLNVVCLSIRDVGTVFEARDLRIEKEGRHIHSVDQSDEVEFV